MVIDAKMEQALNGQIQAEFESAYLYLSMATWFEANDLPGCATGCASRPARSRSTR